MSLSLSCALSLESPTSTDDPVAIVHSYYHENDEIIPVPCDVLCSLIRMGHEFGIQKVLDDALSRLKKYYTSDLSA